MRSKRKLKEKAKRILKRIGVIILLCMLFNHNGRIMKDNIIVIDNRTFAYDTMPVIEIDWENYRLTSYYTNDATGSGSYVGAGLHTNQFQVNSKGWYTYNGKLVVAAATEELLRSKEFPNQTELHTRYTNKHYFRYYDEIKIKIDGVIYQAIILDSCGKAHDQNENRIDLFVSNKASVIDRGYKGINEIQVSVES